MIIGGIQYNLFGDIIFLSTMLLVVIIAFSRTAIRHKIFREEKISSLLPFENINKILIIIISYFLFVGEISIISVGIVLFATIILIIFSIDFKNYKFPKNFNLILISQTISASYTLFIAYLLNKINIGEKTFFLGFMRIQFLVLFIGISYQKGWNELKTLSNEFYKNRFYAAIFGLATVFLEFFLIKEIGVILTILLSFLGAGSILLIGYFYLKDIPKKKDIILTIIILFLVGLGFYFRNYGL